ncbi:CAF17-like 4Fe-4S cluster assembly/insertion protein YgfZ [Kaarinaea lacus]
MTSKQDWLEFLTKEGAIIENDKVSHFKDHEKDLSALRTQTIIASLDDYAVIKVAGDDNMDFLQNQFSNDVRLVNETHSQLNAYCSPKGRVLSLFRVIKQENTYFLLLPQERLQPTLNRLKMFVLRSQVTLQDASDQIGVLGIAGNAATELLSTVVPSLPQQPDDCAYAEGISIINMPGNPGRYLIFAGYEQLKTAWNHCKRQAIPTNAQIWAFWNVQTGLPEVLEINSDEFVPQMLNLHSLNAINFKKGCYPGQEVVARMHYLGKQKRRMYLAHIDADSAPLPGDNVYSAANVSDQDMGQSVGKIVTTTPFPGGGYDVLVVMQIANVENGDTILTQQNTTLNFKELPYFVEVEGKK